MCAVLFVFKTSRDSLLFITVTMVEESAFTSVSQIVEEEKFVPHPPAVGKGHSRPSPRRHHKTEIPASKVSDSNRHVEGIRQHHEQRLVRN